MRWPCDADFDHSYCRGVIHPVQNPGTKPGPLIHCHTAEGHTKAVLSVKATEDLLFSSSKGNSHVKFDNLLWFISGNLGTHHKITNVFTWIHSFSKKYEWVAKSDAQFYIVGF